VAFQVSSTTAAFDAGVKGVTDEFYNVMTVTDCLRPDILPANRFSLANWYADRFSTPSADVDTKFWTPWRLIGAGSYDIGITSPGKLFIENIDQGWKYFDTDAQVFWQPGSGDATEFEIEVHIDILSWDKTKCSYAGLWVQEGPGPSLNGLLAWQRYSTNNKDYLLLQYFNHSGVWVGDFLYLGYDARSYWLKIRRYDNELFFYIDEEDGGGYQLIHTQTTDWTDHLITRTRCARVCNGTVIAEYNDYKLSKGMITGPIGTYATTGTMRLTHDDALDPYMIPAGLRYYSFQFNLVEVQEGISGVSGIRWYDDNDVLQAWWYGTIDTFGAHIITVPTGGDFDELFGEVKVEMDLYGNGSEAMQVSLARNVYAVPGHKLCDRQPNNAGSVFCGG